MATVEELEARIVALENAMPKLRVVRSRHETDSDISDTWSDLYGFKRQVKIDKVGVVIPFLNLDIAHRKLLDTVVGYGARIWYKNAPTQAGLATASEVFLTCGIGAGNIRDITDHYGRATAFAPLAVNPGWYEFGVRANTHSSTPHSSGTLAEVNHSSTALDYNILMLLIVEGATLSF